MIETAIVGSGPSADAQALACLRVPGVNLAGVLPEPGWDADSAVFRDARVFGSIDELTGAEGIRLVSVCTPPRDRRRLVSDLLTTGRSVLLVPPIGASFRDVTTFKKLCRRHNAGIGVMHTLRYHPAFARIKEVASSGALGEITRIGLVRTGPCPSDDALPQHLADYQDLDVCVWLLGPGLQVNHSGSSGLRLEKSGVTATVETSVGADACITRTVTVEGSAGRLDCDVTSPNAIGDEKDRSISFRITYRRASERSVDVPAAVPLLTELGYRASVAKRSENWVCPDLAENKDVLRLWLASKTH